MKTLFVVVFVGIVAAAQASVIGLGLGGIGGIGLGGHGLIGAPALGLTSHAAAQAALEWSVPAGSGLEGQWIPDVNEHLHDDGSWKPHLGW